MDVQLICQQCGEIFIRPYKKRYRKYCSNECYRQTIKGRKLNLSQEELQRRRERVFETGLNQIWIGRVHSEETKEKIRQMKFRNNPQKGRPRTDEEKKKISEASKRHWQNLGYREKSLKERRERDQGGERNPNWKNGSSREVNYGAGWKVNKRHVLKRDKYSCQICGVKQGLLYPKELDVHHILPFRLSCDNAPKNLITVCRYCHGKLESAFVQKIEKNNIDYQKLSYTEIKHQVIQSITC